MRKGSMLTVAAALAGQLLAAAVTAQKTDRLADPPDPARRGLHGAAGAPMNGGPAWQPPRRGQEDLRKLAVGLEAVFSQYYKLKDVGCATAPGVTMCKVEESSLSARLSFEYAVSQLFGIGLGLSRNEFSVWKQYGSLDFDTSVEAWALDGYTFWRFGQIGPFDPYAEFGGSWIRNAFDYPDDFEDNLPDSEAGMRIYFGGGLDYEFTDAYSLHTGYTYVSGGGNDADTHGRVSFGVRREF
jgi:opacity protein-like surface antigen